MVEFRKRKKTTPATPAQRDQAFPIPHGDKRNLPRSLQQVSIGDIPDYWEKRRRAKMTESEQEEQAIIDAAVQEEIEAELEMAKQKNLLVRLGEALDKMQKREQLKKAMAEAKAEQSEDEGKDDGYEEYSENLKKKIDARNEQNEVFG